MFVSGHPGRTNRQNTMDELKYLRDSQYPTQLPARTAAKCCIGSWADANGGEPSASEGRPVRRAEQPEGAHRWARRACSIRS